jgi:uncharacterized protein (DUF1684 family)
MLRRTAALSLLLVPLLALSAATEGAPAPEPYRSEIEAWRAKRIASLKREDGWLSLVGLFWLQEGENRLGSDAASNRIVFPRDTTPKTMGSLDVSRGVVTLRAAPDSDLMSDGHPVLTTLTLRSDAEGSPTIVKHGRISFFLIKRGERLGVRVKDSANPTLLSFHGLDNYPVDRQWRFDARFDAYMPSKTIAVPSILGNVDQEKSPGAVVFQVAGHSYRIDAVQESGSEDLFLIFGDQTNGVETYGGGRFLYTAPPDKDGRVVLDFNKAYNPPCVFTPYATCPLPPAQNRLALRVEAGEKKYGSH